MVASWNDGHGWPEANSATHPVFRNATDFVISTRRCSTCARSGIPRAFSTPLRPPAPEDGEEIEYNTRV
ncbi:isoamyl alcohol oxidase [Colletotrichum higginsianum]|nr:isoamyl alcohol oxidase [Colletotrichum higginsianum]